MLLFNEELVGTAHEIHTNASRFLSLREEKNPAPIKESKSRKMASTTPFLAAVANRHSRYNLLKESPIPNSRIPEIVHHALAHEPGAVLLDACEPQRGHTANASPEPRRERPAATLL